MINERLHIGFEVFKYVQQDRPNKGKSGLYNIHMTAHAHTKVRTLKYQKN